MGERVRLLVRTADGLHGIEIKKFKIAKEIPRGNKPVTMEFTADEAGRFPVPLLRVLRRRPRRHEGHARGGRASGSTRSAVGCSCSPELSPGVDALRAVLCQRRQRAACDEALSDLTGPTPNLEPTFSSIQQEIFDTADSSGRAGVHHLPQWRSRFVPRQLDLPPASYAALVGARSRGRSRALLRVGAGDPENSYMIHKLEGRPNIVGERMPRGGGPFLTDGQMLSSGAGSSSARATTRSQPMTVVETLILAVALLAVMWPAPLAPRRPQPRRRAGRPRTIPIAIFNRSQPDFVVVNLPTTLRRAEVQERVPRHPPVRPAARPGQLRRPGRGSVRPRLRRADRARVPLRADARPARWASTARATGRSSSSRSTACCSRPTRRSASA